MRFVRGYVRDLVASQKNGHEFRIGVTVHPNGELSKKQHLRDFLGRSISGFFNSIHPEADVAHVLSHDGFVPNCEINLK